MTLLNNDSLTNIVQFLQNIVGLSLRLKSIKSCESENQQQWSYFIYIIIYIYYSII